jgi:hypothetical protein
MIAKSLIAAAALATTMAATLPAPEARADVSVGIGIGVNPGFYPGYGYPAYYDPYPGYNPGYNPGYYKPYHNYKKYGISCGKGAKIVDHSGFYGVTPIDCSLPRYKYSAWRKGKQYIVVVNGNGNIVKYYRT